MEAAIETLRGIGPNIKESLSNLHIHQIADLLFHLPIRYEDRTRVTPIKDLRVGDRVVVIGRIVKTTMQPGRRMTLVTEIADETGNLTLRFFHFTASQRQRLIELNKQLFCFGEIRQAYRGGFEMVHPEYREIAPDEPIELSDRLTAIYSTSKGLHQPTIRKLIYQAFAYQADQQGIQELLPASLLTKLQFPTLAEALQYVHYPPPDADIQALKEGNHPAQQRLSFEELLAYHLSLRLRRAEVKQSPAIPLPPAKTLAQKLTDQLPFCLTKAQSRVVQEISGDLSKPMPMQRLVQGDVGSGKTIVAALAAAQALENQTQAVLMAPTEILAEQHYKKFTEWFEPLGIEVGYLVGQMSASERRNVCSKLSDGSLSLVVGTHALFQENVAFKKLGLLIVDEQHRFGVNQRLALKEKGIWYGQHPHQLIMTATPIPRTLAMTAYADLDVSVIDELPPGRKPITTVMISNERRSEIVERVNHNAAEGNQIYWVCTLIEESESLQCQAAEKTAESLQAQLPNLRLGLVHGRMKAEQKEEVMQAFKAGTIDLLVATTVIEVGVDVPNANLIIIENPERLGLAQLHQLRGRVGRGSKSSHCVLLYQTPLSHTAKARLGIMKKTQDGFQIAEADLEIRGPGEVLGTKQSGIMNFRVADLLRDRHLLTEVKRISAQICQDSSEKSQQLIKRWIGSRQQYFDV